MGRIIDRRRVCGSKKEDTYIQDGLVFWLDGIDYGGVPGHWIDKKQNIDFPLNATYTQRTVDSVILENNSSKDISMSGNKTIEGLAYNNSTVEVCLRYWSGVNAKYVNNIILADSQDLKGPWLRVRNNTFDNHLYYTFYSGISSPYKAYHVDSDDNQKILISINSNGEVMFRGNTYTGVYQGEGYSASSVAQLWVARNISYELCSLRIYNKILSAQEMLYNQQIDNKRFNFNIL